MLTIWTGQSFDVVDEEIARQLCASNLAQIVDPSMSCYDLKYPDEFDLPGNKTPSKSYLTRELLAEKTEVKKRRGRPKKVNA